jgi:hypothetical protein
MSKIRGKLKLIWTGSKTENFLIVPIVKPSRTNVVYTIKLEKNIV